MPNDGGGREDDAHALEDALAAAMAAFPDEVRPAVADVVAYRWLGAGVRLGLEHPDRARRLLVLIDARAEGPAPSVEAAVPPPFEGTHSQAGRASVPVASQLLARAATLTQSARTDAGPDVVFGWVAGLSPEDILHVGRVVGDMLAAGAPTDVGLGFGLAWTAGVRVPRQELEMMLEEFTELEITVGGILSGRELRTGERTARPRGLAAWFGGWFPQARPGESSAAAAIDRSGEPGRRGLVALWNVWMAMRYQALIPSETFVLLVHPWVTVVGPLPA